MRDAVAIAARIHAWAQSVPNLHEGWYLVQGKDKRVCKIMWKHPELEKEFFLMKVRLKSSGGIFILEDNRKYVLQILSHPIGILRENRFFAAATVSTSETPKWFLGASPVSFRLDQHGVDGLASIDIKGEKFKIPFQIKSSRVGKLEFFEKWPTYIGVVRVILVDEVATDDILRQRLYSAVGEIRSKILASKHTIEEYHTQMETLFGKYAAEITSAP